MAQKIKADGTVVTTKSNVETGHAKNVASFTKLVLDVAALGPKYNPGNRVIQLLSLKTKEAAVTIVMNELGLAKQAADDAENERTALFDQLPAYSTRIVNTLISSAGVSDLTIKDARSINNKINGKRSAKSTEAIAMAAAEGAEPKRTRSLSQQSFDQKENHFKDLRKLVMAQPTYTPNEADLKPSGLEDYENRLIAANKKMADTAGKLKDARIARDQQLYQGETGIIEMAKKVKSYVLSMFDARHVSYKKINAIPFKTQKDNSSNL